MPRLVSFNKLAKLPVAMEDRFVPAPITGEPACGEPLVFSSAVRFSIEVESQEQAVFHAENEPVNEPFQIKQLPLFVHVAAP